MRSGFCRTLRVWALGRHESLRSARLGAVLVACCFSDGAWVFDFTEEMSGVTANRSLKKTIASNCPQGVDVAFATKEIRDICEKKSRAQKALGALAAERLNHGLADFLAASNVAEVPGIVLPTHGTEIEFELTDGVYLVLRSNHTTTPVSPIDSTDWAQVRRIQILRIGRRT